MSGFSRSFKPSDLSLSNLSLANSPRDDFQMGFPFSGTNTPEPEAHQQQLPPPHLAKSLNSPRFNDSRSLAIEIPQIRKFNTAPTYTPPPQAPLSARGDLPGGYFPLHEDPDTRIERPHPFHTDTTKARRESISTTTAPGVLPPDSATTTTTTTTTGYIQTAMGVSRSEHPGPMTSFLAMGAQNPHLPMGKYYPSNYEKRTTSSRAPSRHPSTMPSNASNKQPPQPYHQPHQQQPRSESEAKSRLQQYQRDMIAQTRLAASDIVDITGRVSGTSTPRSPFRLATSVLTTPMSPYIHPLGSPGPITPMTLDDPEGDYLCRGQGSAPTTGVDAAGSVRLEKQRGKR